LRFSSLRAALSVLLLQMLLIVVSVVVTLIGIVCATMCIGPDEPSREM
jgi:hypothetical protein